MKNSQIKKHKKTLIKKNTENVAGQIELKDIKWPVREPWAVNNNKYQKLYLNWMEKVEFLHLLNNKNISKIKIQTLKVNQLTKMQNAHNDMAYAVNKIAKSLKLDDSFLISYVDYVNSVLPNQDENAPTIAKYVNRRISFDEIKGPIYEPEKILCLKFQTIYIEWLQLINDLKKINNNNLMNIINGEWGLVQIRRESALYNEKVAEVNRIAKYLQLADSFIVAEVDYLNEEYIKNAQIDKSYFDSNNEIRFEEIIGPIFDPSRVNNSKYQRLYSYWLEEINNLKILHNRNIDLISDVMISESKMEELQDEYNFLVKDINELFEELKLADRFKVARVNYFINVYEKKYYQEDSGEKTFNEIYTKESNVPFLSNEEFSEADSAEKEYLKSSLNQEVIYKKMVREIQDTQKVLDDFVNFEEINEEIVNDKTETEVLVKKEINNNFVDNNFDKTLDHINLSIEKENEKIDVNSHIEVALFDWNGKPVFNENKVQLIVNSNMKKIDLEKVFDHDMKPLFDSSKELPYGYSLFNSIGEQVYDESGEWITDKSKTRVSLKTKLDNNDKLNLSHEGKVQAGTKLFDWNGNPVFDKDGKQLETDGLSQTISILKIFNAEGENLLVQKISSKFKKSLFNESGIKSLDILSDEELVDDIINVESQKDAESFEEVEAIEPKEAMALNENVIKVSNAGIGILLFDKNQNLVYSNDKNPLELKIDLKTIDYSNVFNHEGKSLTEVDKEISGLYDSKGKMVFDAQGILLEEEINVENNNQSKIVKVPAHEIGTLLFYYNGKPAFDAENKQLSITENTKNINAQELFDENGKLFLEQEDFEKFGLSLFTSSRDQVTSSSGSLIFKSIVTEETNSESVIEKTVSETIIQETVSETIIEETVSETLIEETKTQPIFKEIVLEKKEDKLNNLFDEKPSKLFETKNNDNLDSIKLKSNLVNKKPFSNTGFAKIGTLVFDKKGKPVFDRSGKQIEVTVDFKKITYSNVFNEDGKPFFNFKKDNKGNKSLYDFSGAQIFDSNGILNFVEDKKFKLPSTIFDINGNQLYTADKKPILINEPFEKLNFEEFYNKKGKIIVFNENKAIFTKEGVQLTNLKGRFLNEDPMDDILDSNFDLFEIDFENEEYKDISFTEIENKEHRTLVSDEIIVAVKCPVVKIGTLVYGLDREQVFAKDGKPFITNGQVMSISEAIYNKAGKQVFAPGDETASQPLFDKNGVMIYKQNGKPVLKITEKIVQKSDIKFKLLTNGKEIKYIELGAVEDGQDLYLTDGTPIFTEAGQRLVMNKSMKTVPENLFSKNGVKIENKDNTKTLIDENGIFAFDETGNLKILWRPVEELIIKKTEPINLSSNSNLEIKVESEFNHVQEPEVIQVEVNQPVLEDSFVTETEVEETQVEKTEVEETEVEETEVEAPAEETEVEETEVEETEVEETEVEETEVEETEVEETEVEETEVEETEVEETEVEETEETEVEETETELTETELTETKATETEETGTEVEEIEIDETGTEVEEIEIQPEEYETDENEVKDEKIDYRSIDELSIEQPIINEPIIEEESFADRIIVESSNEYQDKEKELISSSKMEDSVTEDSILLGTTIENPIDILSSLGKADKIEENINEIEPIVESDLINKPKDGFVYVIVKTPVFPIGTMCYKEDKEPVFTKDGKPLLTDGQVSKISESIFNKWGEILFAPEDKEVDKSLFDKNGKQIYLSSGKPVLHSKVVKTQFDQIKIKMLPNGKEIQYIEMTTIKEGEKLYLIDGTPVYNQDGTSLLMSSSLQITPEKLYGVNGNEIKNIDGSKSLINHEGILAYDKNGKLRKIKEPIVEIKFEEPIIEEVASEVTKPVIEKFEPIIEEPIIEEPIIEEPIIEDEKNDDEVDVEAEEYEVEDEEYEEEVDEVEAEPEEYEVEEPYLVDVIVRIPFASEGTMVFTETMDPVYDDQGENFVIKKNQFLLQEVLYNEFGDILFSPTRKQINKPLFDKFGNKIVLPNGELTFETKKISVNENDIKTEVLANGKEIEFVKINSFGPNVPLFLKNGAPVYDVNGERITSTGVDEPLRTNAYDIYGKNLFNDPANFENGKALFNELGQMVYDQTGTPVKKKTYIDDGQLFVKPIIEEIQIVEEPIIEESIIEEPITEEPIIEEPIMDEIELVVTVKKPIVPEGTKLFAVNKEEVFTNNGRPLVTDGQASKITKPLYTLDGKLLFNPEEQNVDKSLYSVDDIQIYTSLGKPVLINKDLIVKQSEIKSKILPNGQEIKYLERKAVANGDKLFLTDWTPVFDSNGKQLKMSEDLKSAPSELFYESGLEISFDIDRTLFNKKGLVAFNAKGDLKTIKEPIVEIKSIQEFDNSEILKSNIEAIKNSEKNVKPVKKDLREDEIILVEPVAPIGTLLYTHDGEPVYDVNGRQLVLRNIDEPINSKIFDASGKNLVDDEDEKPELFDDHGKQVTNSFGSPEIKESIIKINEINSENNVEEKIEVVYVSISKFGTKLYDSQNKPVFYSNGKQVTAVDSTIELDFQDIYDINGDLFIDKFDSKELFDASGTQVIDEEGKTIKVKRAVRKLVEAEKISSIDKDLIKQNINKSLEKEQKSSYSKPPLNTTEFEAAFDEANLRLEKIKGELKLITEKSDETLKKPLSPFAELNEDFEDDYNLDLNYMKTPRSIYNKHKSQDDLQPLPEMKQNFVPESNEFLTKIEERMNSIESMLSILTDKGKSLNAQKIKILKDDVEKINEDLNNINLAVSEFGYNQSSSSENNGFSICGCSPTGCDSQKRKHHVYNAGNNLKVKPGFNSSNHANKHRNCTHKKQEQQSCEKCGNLIK